MLRTLKAYTLHPPSISIGLVFMTLSMLFSSWIARLPETQTILSLSEGQIGLALLGLPIGSFIITPITTWILKRLSLGKATTLASYLVCVAIVIPSFAIGQWSLMLSLILLGLCNGLLNVSMNAATASIEKHFSISIMSTCHGMFSLGAMIGAATGGLIAITGVPLTLHLIGLSSLLLLLNIALRPILINIPDQPAKGTAFALPSKPLLGLAFIGFCIMIGEGAVFDWSAVYLKNYLGSSAIAAGFGLAGFSFAMAIGRFSGDRVRDKFGDQSVVQAGALLGALGLSIAIFLPYPTTAIIGFTLVGFGFSSVVPILFSKAAQLPDLSPGAGIAAIATMGIIGFFIGPPLIGFVGEHYGLTYGLAFVALLSLIAAYLSTKVQL